MGAPKHLELVGLASLMRETAGSAAVPVAMIDGPVHAEHAALAGATITRLQGEGPVGCTSPASPACQHGTFVAGVLAAGRETELPGLCPGSPLLVRPIFCEASDLGECPVVTPQHLADAVEQCVDAGARVINLSLGLSRTGISSSPALTRSFDRAAAAGVLLVGAAGNHGNIGRTGLLDHPWLVLAVACDRGGRPIGSNLGASIGRRGLLAPGHEIPGLAATGGYHRMTGTSAAAPFISGALALLWAAVPEASAAALRSAVLEVGGARRSIVPPRLDATAALARLRAG